MDILFCVECGNCFQKDSEGNILELDRISTPQEESGESSVIGIRCRHHN